MAGRLRWGIRVGALGVALRFFCGPGPVLAEGRIPELRLPEPLPPLEPEPEPEFEPEPAPSAPVAPPVPRPVVARPPLAEPRPPVAVAVVTVASGPRPAFSLELAPLFSAHAQLRTYGFGGGLELGGRLQLRLVGLGLGLRFLYEGYVRPDPAQSILSIALPLTLRPGRPSWRVLPYLGAGPQLLFARVPEALGVSPSLRSEAGAAFGVLLGLQIRAFMGGPFIEAGYRHTLYNQSGFTYPAWNSGTVLIGYRLTSR